MFKVAYITDVGVKRSSNQDAVFFSEDLNLCIVADGMGGHNAGEIASELAVETIKNYIEFNKKIISNTDLILNSINEANSKIYLESIKNEKYSGMGTTCSLFLCEDSNIFIGHVGDSRIYYITDDLINQLTEDHTLVESLVKSGEITREAAKLHPKRNVILRALGTDSDVKIDTFQYSVVNKSKILICSDGLTSEISDEEIFDIINNNTLEKSVEVLVSRANEYGGADNITVLLSEFDLRC